MRRPGIPVRLPDGRVYLVEIDPERIAQQLAASADVAHFGVVSRLGGGVVVRRQVRQ